MKHWQDARATTQPAATALYAVSRRIQLAGAVAVVVCLLVPPAVARRDIQRYEVILQRRPFGFVPPEEAPVRSVPVATGPSFADRLQMVAITERGGRIRVGFVDNNVNPARTYFLHVGDSADGYTVVDADFEAETARVRKDGQDAQLAIRRGGRSGGGPGGGPGVGPAMAAAGGGNLRDGRPAARRPASSRPGLTREQYEAEREAGLRGAPVSPRRALRQDEAPSMAELPPAVREHAMRQYNMELIRAGGDLGVPLPIPLTPEEDARLVQEGVLDP